MKTEIFCTFRIEGIHNWSDCPFDEVKYLRVPHRHMFHMKVYKEVTHADRQVEFIMLQHRVESFLLSTYGQPIMHKTDWEICDNKLVCVFGEMSCEMIAELLIKTFNLSRCEVSEDGENGAVVSNVV